jgi:hypothetical protein
MQITMSSSSKIAAPNALLLISDVGGGKPPDVMQGALIASTPSCIAVGCMADSNGKTEVTLGTVQELRSHESPAFEGKLETPSRAIVVQTVFRQTILQAPVPGSSTRVRIWVNHPSEPDRVTIGLE